MRTSFPQPSTIPPKTVFPDKTAWFDKTNARVKQTGGLEAMKANLPVKSGKVEHFDKKV